MDVISDFASYSQVPKSFRCHFSRASCFNHQKSFCVTLLAFRNNPLPAKSHWIDILEYQLTFSRGMSLQPSCQQEIVSNFDISHENAFHNPQLGLLYPSWVMRSEQVKWHWLTQVSNIFQGRSICHIENFCFWGFHVALKLRRLVECFDGVWRHYQGRFWRLEFSNGWKWKLRYGHLGS